MKLYGLMAEFPTAEALLGATRALRARGYTHIDAYSPFPVEGLAEAEGGYRDRIPLLTLLGGLVGGTGGFLLQWYAATIDYPVNVGGRPLNSWPSFIPATFELAVLGAALAAVAGAFALSGLPQLYHPVFNVPAFGRASRKGFFLCVRSDEPGFGDGHALRQEMLQLDATGVHEVPW